MDRKRRYVHALSPYGLDVIRLAIPLAPRPYFKSLCYESGDRANAGVRCENVSQSILPEKFEAYES